MKTITAAKAIKEHLLKHWENAESWSSNAKSDWSGGQCLITLQEEVGIFYSTYLPREQNKIGSGLLDLLIEDGKEAVLQYLDFLILGNAESERSS